MLWAGWAWPVETQRYSLMSWFLWPWLLAVLVEEMAFYRKNKVSVLWSVLAAMLYNTADEDMFIACTASLSTHVNTGEASALLSPSQCFNQRSWHYYKSGYISSLYICLLSVSHSSFGEF